MSMLIDILEDEIISDYKDITNIENDENCKPEQRIDNLLNGESKNTENGEDINITLEMGNNKTRENVKKVNQILREKGKSYLGHRQPAEQSRTFQDTQRSESKIGPSFHVYTDLPIRPTAIQPVVFPRLFKERLPIKNTKFDHLQQLKPVIPSDCWTFYDNLPHSDK
ncbi:hypothetical protein RN001_005112 [Aquatica leii]|uniref:Uncharacterized protein n=1 Tax=Aquatica leii TaxID=1421715 RepID=A0AAN7QK00_9COLE|nr:hypothetical protein RN001_005112 [Aquatica leii]